MTTTEPAARGTEAGPPAAAPCRRPVGGLRGVLQRVLRRTSGAERGSMAIEIVILTPILVAVALLVVAGGRYVSLQGQIDSATRDAARSASLARDAGSARAAALDTAEATLPPGATCRNLVVDTADFYAGGHVDVRITCDVSYSGLGLLGVPGAKTIDTESTAPIDIYRRTG